MQITINGNGGYTGLSEVFELDTADCNPADAHELAEMLQDVHFFDEAPELATQAIGADMMQWEITVSDDGHQHSVRFTDDGSPGLQPWKEIVEKVRTLH